SIRRTCDQTTAVADDQEGALTYDPPNDTLTWRETVAAPSSHRSRRPSRRRARPGAITARLRSGTGLAGSISLSPQSPAPHHPYWYGGIACCGPAELGPARRGRQVRMVDRY